MSIEQQIKAAWEEYLKENNGMFDAPLYCFAAGYRAALRNLLKEVDPSEMIVGRYYWVAGMIGEMQGFKNITGKDGVARIWPIINGEYVCANIFVVRGPIPNPSEFPLADIFREEVTQ